MQYTHTQELIQVYESSPAVCQAQCAFNAYRQQQQITLQLATGPDFALTSIPSVCQDAVFPTTGNGSCSPACRQLLSVVRCTPLWVCHLFMLTNRLMIPTAGGDWSVCRRLASGSKCTLGLYYLCMFIFHTNTITTVAVHTTCAPSPTLLVHRLQPCCRWATVA